MMNSSLSTRRCPLITIVPGPRASRARVFSKNGKDVTQEFLDGARKTWDKVRAVGAKAAILKERSPSCGVNQVYDGTFSGKKRPGCGVAAALLKQNGVILNSEENCEELLKNQELKNVKGRNS